LAGAGAGKPKMAANDSDSRRQPRVGRCFAPERSLATSFVGLEARSGTEPKPAPLYRAARYLHVWDDGGVKPSSESAMRGSLGDHARAQPGKKKRASELRKRYLQ
jgi:hypothetical protein